MKNSYLILFTASLMSFAACESTKSDKEETTVETEEVTADEAADYSGMQKLDLSDYAIAGSLYIPNENKGKAKINETAYGSVQIVVGDRFGLEIVPFGQSLEEKKAELSNDLVYELNVIEEDENYMMFEKSIKESDVEPEYHFFMNVELDGEIYEIKSITDNAYSKAAVESMLKSAQSFSPQAVS